MWCGPLGARVEAERQLAGAAAAPGQAPLALPHLTNKGLQLFRSNVRQAGRSDPITLRAAQRQATGRVLATQYHVLRVTCCTLVAVPRYRRLPKAGDPDAQHTCMRSLRPLPRTVATAGAAGVPSSAAAAGGLAVAVGTCHSGGAAGAGTPGPGGLPWYRLGAGRGRHYGGRWRQQQRQC